MECKIACDIILLPNTTFIVSYGLFTERKMRKRKYERFKQEVSTYKHDSITKCQVPLNITIEISLSILWHIIQNLSYALIRKSNHLKSLCLYYLGWIYHWNNIILWNTKLSELLFVTYWLLPYMTWVCISVCMFSYFQFNIGDTIDNLSEIIY